MTMTTDENQNRSSRQGLSSLARRGRLWLGQSLVALGQQLAGPPPAAAAAALPAPSGTLDPEATSGDRFANLASMIPGVVYQRIVFPDGAIRYTYISEGAREVFGVSPEEVMADPEALFKTYSDDYKANFRQRLVAASKTLTKWDVEASIVAPDGNIRYTHAIAKPEALPDGSVLWTGLILDATRIKQVEEELKAAYRTVEAATKAKSMFLANMSHEIRTPMNGVLGMADLLLKTDLQPRQHRLLSTLKHSAQTLLGIINDVLDISRIEAGRFHMESETFDLRRCLEDAVDLCAGAAYQKGLELNLIVAGTLPRAVRGDSTRLRQILINLIGNAVKFTETGDATLRVTSTIGEDGKSLVRLDVIDTGIGIDRQAKERLFAPFAQADSSITRRFGGTGLGLAITRHLVDLMGGTVELESELGQGTRVSALLPFEIVDAGAEASASPPPLADLPLLVVDDRERVREAVASMLEGTGARVDQASDEEQARSMLRLAAELGTPYAVAIVDRLRPGADSLEVGRQIACDGDLAPLHVINIVTMNWKGDQPPAHESVTRSIIAKPLRRDDLLATITRVDDLLAGVGSMQGLELSVDGGEVCEAGSDLGMHVLVAEDNPVNQEVVREYLSALGCTVVLAENGEEAIAALGGEAFDIVLMDCQMPVLDGLSAAQQIREQEAATGRPRLPIVAVTANAYESDRIAAQEAGMDDYLVKPFTDEALRDVLLKWRDASPRSAQAAAA